MLGSDWRGAALAVGGLVLTFSAPTHRVDLLVFGVGATLGGMVWSPRSGPGLVAAALPFFFFSRPLIGPIGVTPPGLALLCAWAAVLARRREVNLSWAKTGYEAPLALFLGAALLSLLVTEYPLLSARELRALILEPVLFLWLLGSVRGAPQTALVGFLAGATLTAAAAIGQVPLGVGGTEAEGVRRAQAWYPSANHLALMLGRALPFLFSASLVGPRAAAWLPCVVVATALLLTFSTGGWVGGLSAILVVVGMTRRRGDAVRLGVVAAVCGLAVAALAAAGVLPERLNPLRQTGGFRLELWLASLQMARDHPLLGIGLDNFAYVYQQGYLREGLYAEPNLSHPHNWLLNMWLSLGLAGLAAFLWLILRFVGRLRAHQFDWRVAGAAGAVADMLVHGFVDNSYFLVDLAFVFWLTLAVVAANARSNSRIDRT